MSDMHEPKFQRTHASTYWEAAAERARAEVERLHGEVADWQRTGMEIENQYRAELARCVEALEDAHECSDEVCPACDAVGAALASAKKTLGGGE